jgi:hypothetical protein
VAFSIFGLMEATLQNRAFFCRGFSVVLSFGAPLYFFLVNKVGESEAVEGAHQLVPNLTPGAMNRTEDVPFAGAFPRQAKVDVERSFLGLHYIEQGDLLRMLEEVETASDSPLGADYAGLDQGLQNLGEKSRSNVLSPANVLFENNFSARLFSKEKHCADCIFRGAGDKQGYTSN